jgi:hypothetical protein
MKDSELIKLKWWSFEEFFESDRVKASKLYRIYEKMVLRTFKNDRKSIDHFLNLSELRYLMEKGRQAG